MENKDAKASIIRVIPGIDSDFAVVGIRNSKGKLENGVFVDSVSEYEAIEHLDMLFANIELGKEYALIFGNVNKKADDVKVKKFRNPFFN